MSIVTKELSRKIRAEGIEWQIQCVIPALDGQNFVHDPEIGFWRMISFIKDSSSFDLIGSRDQAYELGRALKVFHLLLDELHREKIGYVLEDFHIVPEYLRIYDEASLQDDLPTGTLVDYAHRLVERYRGRADSLERGRECGDLPLRIIHGDPKINNIMFDTHTGRAVSMIDLDTIQPGLLHYDIGDCARSSCNPLGEEERDRWSDVRFDTDIFAQFWRGYRSEGRSMLSAVEMGYIYDSLFVIAYEMGLRFFTDYLNGDVYFKTSYPDNNLYRALVQLTLAESIDAQKDEILEIILEEI
jgi:Ser/Thr protein kinase RdoA (MazF antagonist)